MLTNTRHALRPARFAARGSRGVSTSTDSSAILTLLDAEMIPAAQGHAILSPAHREFCAVLARRSIVRSGTIWAADLDAADADVILASWERGPAGWAQFANSKADPVATVRGIIEHGAIIHHLTHTGGCVLSPAAIRAVEALRSMGRQAATDLLARRVRVHGEHVSLAEALMRGDSSTEIIGRARALDTDWHDSDAGQGSVRMRSVTRSMRGPRASDIILAA